MKSVKNLFKAIMIVCLFVVMAVPLMGIIYLFTDEQGTCKDMGGVWDDNEKRCRNDCLEWNKEYGCILLTPAQIRKMENCQIEKGPCLSDEDFFEICQNNRKAWDADKKECRFQFRAEECEKLSGNWYYPDICRE